METLTLINRVFKKIVIVIFGIYILLELVFSGIWINYRALLSQANTNDVYGIQPDGLKNQVLSVLDNLNSMLDIIFPYFFLCIFVFLIWVYQANKKLYLLNNIKPKFSPFFAAFSFLIPIANLFLPYKAVKEIWVLSVPKEKSNSFIVSLWWSCCILSMLMWGVFFFVSIHDAFKAHSELFSGLFFTFIFMQAFYIASAVLAIWIMIVVNKSQNDKIHDNC